MRPLILSMLLLGSGMACAETCQNVTTLTTTLTCDGQYQLFGSYGFLAQHQCPHYYAAPTEIEPSGVDCEVTVQFVGAPRTAVAGLGPPYGHFEGLEYRFPLDSPITELRRELAINPDIRTMRATVYRQVYTRYNSGGARAPELDVLLEPIFGSNDSQVVVLWRQFHFAQSQDWQGVTTRIAELPVSNTVQTNCAGLDSYGKTAPACVRTRWKYINGIAPVLYVDVESGGSIDSASVSLSTTYPRLPSMKIGYLSAQPTGNDRSGMVKLRHRVMCMTPASGSVPVCPSLGN